ncbi:MAK10-like protein [Tanacetum coccineum]
MGDENPPRTLEDYSRPSYKGYRNTIELPEGNNVVPLPSDWCQTDVQSTESGKLRLFQFSLRDQASNWLERLPARSISTWEDLTTHFLPHFLPPGRTIKLRNDIFMFQQNHGESFSEAWTRFKDLLQKFPHHGIDIRLQVQIFYDHVNSATRHAIDHSAGGDSKPFDTLANLGSCVNLIPLHLLKTLNIIILEETENVLGLADGTNSYPVGIVKNVEVYVWKLKLLEDFYIIDMEKDPTCPLLVRRGFLATASAIIDCKKAKITVGEGVTRSIFKVKEIGLGHVDTPYWTTLAKWKSYESRPSTNYIGARPPYYLEKDFMNNYLFRELEIARDAELNPFKDVLVFKKIVDFLKAIPINLKRNMWESEDLIEKKID